MDLNQITLQVADIARSKAFYRKIGFRPVVDVEHYARFLAPGGGTTFSIHIDESGQRAPAGLRSVLYMECETVDNDFRRLKTMGIDFHLPPTDQPWLWREARFYDPDGHEWVIYTAGKNRLDPPWKVESDAQ